MIKIIILGLVATISLIISTVASTFITDYMKSKPVEKEQKPSKPAAQKENKTSTVNPEETHPVVHPVVPTGPGNIDAPYIPDTYYPPSPRQTGPGNL